MGGVVNGKFSGAALVGFEVREAAELEDFGFGLGEDALPVFADGKSIGIGVDIEAALAGFEDELGVEGGGAGANDDGDPPLIEGGGEEIDGDASGAVDGEFIEWSPGASAFDAGAFLEYAFGQEPVNGFVG